MGMLYAIHGFSETDLAWADLLVPARLKHRSLLLPGHGAKPCAPDVTLPTTAADYAAEMPLDGSGDLVGYSMGGRVALRLALDHPQRVRRLILVSCCPGIADDQRRAIRLKEDEAIAEILEQDGLGTFVAPWEANPVFSAGRTLAPAVKAKVRSRRLNHEPDGLAAAIRQLGQGRMESLWDRLGELQMPVLLVAGEADTKYLDMMQAMAQAIPYCELVTLPGVGHAVHREAPPELTEAMIDFLIRPDAAA
jgi:2-succinyl-6-hydroxy-2,4-cyclohexadiene-1-carboxylate synthase